MQKLKSLTVSQSMAIVFLAGVAVAVLSAALSLRGDLADRGLLARDRALLEATRQIGAIVHEMQLERGLSLAWLTAPVPALGEDLAIQRMRTDDALTRARLERPRLVAAVGAPDFDELDAWLSDLRARVDAGALQPVPFGAEMSAETARLIGLVSAFATRAHSGRVAIPTKNLASLMAAKDALGLETAIGARILARQAAGRPAIPWDVRDMEDQEIAVSTWLGSYRLLADPDGRNLLDLWERSRAARRFAAARADILAANVAGVPATIPVSQWMMRADAVVADLRGLEIAEIDLLFTRLDAELAAARNAMLRHLAAFLAALAGLGAVALVVTRRVDRSIRALISSVCRLSVDARSARVTPCPQRDLNRIAGALQILRAAQIERSLAIQAEEELRNSVDEELDRVLGAVEAGTTDQRMDVLGLDAHGAVLARGVNRLLDQIERDKAVSAARA